MYKSLHEETLPGIVSCKNFTMSSDKSFYIRKVRCDLAQTSPATYIAS